MKSAIVSILGGVKCWFVHAGSIVDLEIFLPLIIFDVIDPCYLNWLIPFSIDHGSRNSTDWNSFGAVRCLPIGDIAAKEEFALISAVGNRLHLIIDNVEICIAGPIF